jgi:hypothetical protein
MAVECVFNLGNAIVSFAGVALGGLVGYCSARRVSDRNSMAVAVAKFRAAFSHTQAQLAIAIRHNDDFTKPNVSNVLKDDFIRHAAAIEEFRPFVTCKNREAYQQAWQEYCELEPTIWDGGILKPPHEDQAAEVVFEQKIHNILLFSKT